MSLAPPPVEAPIDRPPSLAALVADRLRREIIDAELPLGGELSEVAVAARLGVSRTPVREALGLLQQRGMVQIIPQKGSYVFFPTERDLVDLCDYRIVIELRAVVFALARAREATMAGLRAALSDMEAARARHDPVAYARADTAFHDAFIGHCGNRFLQEGYDLVAGQVATLRTHLSVPLEGVQERSWDEHRAIAAAFAEGDLIGLESLLMRHVLGTRDSYLRALQQGIIVGGGAAARTPAANACDPVVVPVP